MFLYGKNSVSQRLKSNPKSIRKIFFQSTFSEPSIEKLIKNKNISLKHVSSKELQRIKCADALGGIVAEVDKFQYADLDDLLGEGRRFSSPTLVLLDRVCDPQNLGAIMRTAACFGKFAIVLPKHKACPITDTVLHVAQGAENFIPVVIVSNLTNAMLAAKKSGYWVVGTVVRDGEDINKVSLPFPLCFVLGSEGEGIRYGVEKHLDLKVRIPMEGTALSLNVSTACAIFCHEITKQRNK